MFVFPRLFKIIRLAELEGGFKDHLVTSIILNKNSSLIIGSHVMFSYKTIAFSNLSKINTSDSHLGVKLDAYLMYLTEM